MFERIDSTYFSDVLHVLLEQYTTAGKEKKHSKDCFIEKL